VRPPLTYLSFLELEPETVMRNLALLSILCLPLSGCLVAGAGVGVVAANQLANNNVYVMRVHQDATVAWGVTKKFLASESSEVIQYDDETRIAQANIGDATVQVKVEAWDVDQCQISVAAKRFFATVNDGDLAKLISERLQRRLEN